MGCKVLPVIKAEAYEFTGPLAVDLNILKYIKLCAYAIKKPKN